MKLRTNKVPINKVKAPREIRVDDRAAEEQMRLRTRRGFLTAGVAAAAGIGGYAWLKTREKIGGVPWPQRLVLGANENLAHAYLSDARLLPTYSLADVGKLRPNGQFGLDDDVDEDDWRLNVDTGAGMPPLALMLADLQALPKVEMITKFCCIEGWSVVTRWAGARFADFTRKYFPPGQTLPKFVFMATPNEAYYVGLDTKSALHPQTLLAYEMNGEPLEDEHGAPLRLVIPVKYGVKNIKRLGLIRYTDTRPADYWYERGYDWFVGL